MHVCFHFFESTAEAKEDCVELLQPLAAPVMEDGRLEVDPLDAYVASLEGAVAQEAASRLPPVTRTARSSSDARYRRALRHIAAGHPFFSTAIAEETAAGIGAASATSAAAEVRNSSSRRKRPTAPTVACEPLWGEAEPAAAAPPEPGSGASQLAALIDATVSAPARAPSDEAELLHGSEASAPASMGYASTSSAPSAAAAAAAAPFSRAAVVAAAAAARAGESALEDLIARYVAGERIPDDEFDDEEDEEGGGGGGDDSDGCGASAAYFDAPDGDGAPRD